MSRVKIRMDAEIEFEDSLALSSLTPLGYGVPFLKARKLFVLISRSTGVLQFFKDEEELELYGMFSIRMRVREAWMGKRNMDFRVYRWDGTGWVLHMNTVELEDLRSVLNQASRHARQEQEVHA